MTPLPALNMKPGACGYPFFGVTPVLLEPSSGTVLTENEVTGVLCMKGAWPGLLQTIDRDRRRMLKTYFSPYPGYYFTGDAAYRDKDGFYWIIGRVDDVVNVNGHRFGTAEFENALITFDDGRVAETAVCGYPHDIKGSALAAFVVLKDDVRNKEALSTPEKCAVLNKALINHVRQKIGPVAIIDRVVYIPELPKTRSGKIVRRMLRSAACMDVEGLRSQDATTLANPGSLNSMIEAVVKQKM